MHTDLLREKKKIYLSLLQILCLVLWIVNTSGEQCKQANGTQQKVKG